MAKPINIGGMLYPTKKAAAEAIRVVLYAYPIGATVDAVHADFLARVLDHHPERDEKVGVGVASFQVEQNEGSRGFWLTRVDGSRTDWSFLSCLRPASHRDNALAGFREAIRDQIFEFKRRAFSATEELVCPVTGDRVRFDDCHVDHELPFLDIVDWYLRAIHADFGDIAVKPGVDGSTRTELADDDIRRGWQVVHAEMAKLRIVSKRANLSVLRRRDGVVVSVSR